MIEEVRRHFGYTIDPRDERFKELLEAKEKAQRKAMKESKRADKESKLIAKLTDASRAKKDEVPSKKTDENEEKKE